MIFSGRATYCICYKLFDPNIWSVTFWNMQVRRLMECRIGTWSHVTLIFSWEWRHWVRAVLFWCYAWDERDVVSWNSVISRYLQTTQLSEVDWSNLCDFREFYCTTTAVLNTCRGLHSLTKKTHPLGYGLFI